MQNSMIWFDRKFQFILPTEMFAIVIERLRGTPARLEEKLAYVSLEALTKSEGSKWSILENVGHLLVVMELWERRIVDYNNRVEELYPADLENAKTKESNFNEQSLGYLLKEFRTRQEQLIEDFEAFSDDEAGLTALHPRLKTPMRLIDLAFFIAEHDDHHLACITGLLRKYSHNTV